MIQRVLLHLERYHILLEIKAHVFRSSADLERLRPRDVMNVKSLFKTLLNTKSFN